MLSIAAGLSARSETASAFNRDILSDGHQLGLYGMALLFTFLPTRLPILQELLGLTSLSGEQWLLAIVLASALLLVDEVNRSRKTTAFFDTCDSILIRSSSRIISSGSIS